ITLLLKVAGRRVVNFPRHQFEPESVRTRLLHSETERLDGARLTREPGHDPRTDDSLFSRWGEPLQRRPRPAVRLGVQPIDRRDREHGAHRTLAPARARWQGADRNGATPGARRRYAGRGSLARAGGPTV